MKTVHFPLLILVAAVLPAQDLTPRELFFAAPAIKAKAAAPAARPPQARISPPQELAKAKPRVEEVQSGAPVERVKPKTAIEPQRQEMPVIPASYINSQPPLGLRYSLLLSRANDPYREVDAATAFRSGDRLKVTIEANDDAYLYVISRGSSGLWKVFARCWPCRGNRPMRFMPWRRFCLRP